MQAFKPTDLRVDSVISYYAQKDEIFKADVVDLSQLRYLDSSAVAFLVQFAKSKGENVKLKLIHAPSELMGLITIFKLNDFFLVEN